MAEQPKIEEVQQQQMHENPDSSVSENPGGHFDRRGGGRGGRGFRGGRGGFQGRNDNPDFRGRGRGRGFFRGGPPRGPGGDDRPQGEEGDMDMSMGFRPRGPMDKIGEKIKTFGPTFELPPLCMSEKKFNGKNRLYIGNIGRDVEAEDINEVFKPFGETAETFLNKEKSFAFINFDYHANAEKAKRELDGTPLKGRTLKIRFAPSSSTIKVKNLTPFVTNELLYYAFSPFGEIEKAIVLVDERGKPTGEGYIHFARKFSAAAAVKRCTEGCYFLGASLQPVIAELSEVVDDADGYSDKNIIKKNEFFQEREQPPRFAQPNSFEFEYGEKWKALYELHQQKEEALKKELQLEKEKIVAQMEYARYEHETEMLRNQLKQREMDKDRQKKTWEMKERMADEERVRHEEEMRRQQEQMEARMSANAEDMRRRQQENTLFMQAHNLNSILNQTEEAFNEPPNGGGGDNNFNYGGGGNVMEPKQFMSSYERRDNNQFERRERGGHAGRGHWVSDNRRGDDNFQNKRRRF